MAQWQQVCGCHIHAVVTAGLLTAGQCWELWRAKNPGGSVDAAHRNLLLHLASLDARRPLDSIADPSERERARQVRDWFRDDFLKG